jgi:hypothetical protein
MSIRKATDVAPPTSPAKTLTYHDFIADKAQSVGNHGFAPESLPSYLYDFQSALVEWALRKGRAAIFADCGLGKTPMQLAWADAVVRRENRPVLLLTPLAVCGQTIREGEKFGVDCKRPDGTALAPRVYVTNYERLHHFDSADFAAVVCDESSILKSFDGVTRSAVTAFMRKLPYRLLCTATAAPNDTVELGTSSEALGYLGHMDMIGRFFVNDKKNCGLGRHSGNAPEWRFRGHAEHPFWRWTCSWARSIRKPSDLGFDDARFTLPELVEREHLVSAEKPRDGFLFSVPAVGLREEREERRRTLRERCETAAKLVVDTGQPAVMWCHLNDEGNLITSLVPGAVQVSGTDSDEDKESKFADFAAGKIRVLVTKPIIGAWGLNWQHCAHMTTFASHSFEQHYQTVRRFWRFGQTRPVTVDHVISEGEARVLANLRRKQEAAEKMYESINGHMRDALGISGAREYTKTEEVPPWL